MKRPLLTSTILVAAGILAFPLLGSAQQDPPPGPSAAANTYGSVEPIPNPDVIDTGPLRDQSLAVKEAFAERSFECGVVDEVIDALTSSGAVTTIDGLNTSFDVAAGGFAGETNPAFVYIVVDSGPNAASTADIETLTNSLGYVLSQGSAFLLDGDNPAAFDFPANYVVLNFDSTPTMEESAALFETVGAIDPDLFETDTSGYTQYGRAYLSLQSDVPDQLFIDGYVEAAAQAGVEYTPGRRRRPRAVHGRRCVPRQRLGSQPRRRGLPGSHPGGEPRRAGGDPRRPRADHPRRAAHRRSLVAPRRPVRGAHHPRPRAAALPLLSGRRPVHGRGELTSAGVEHPVVTDPCQRPRQVGHDPDGPPAR